ncbi:MAG: amidase [Chloroflexi bacterium]|nr:amidase [Chloroflexota bacterium]
MSELAFKTATELARLLRAKKISSLELTEMFLDRLKRLGPKYNALAQLTPELAIEQARRADKRRASGSSLHGIPYGAKDLLATKNIPTRWGSPAHRDQIFDYDATVIHKLADAGAPLLGKLAMVEIAGGGGYEYANASLHGPGLNPWDLTRWSGGSSSGSGSAVAAGLVPFALGSETWGSIVTPSAYCGITGLRPTWGLVSRYGAMELAWSMDKVGAMARSAEDCGWILQAIAGRDDNDVTVTREFRFKPRRARRNFRLGVLDADFTDEPAIEKAYKEAIRVLKKIGMKITRTQLPERPYAETARTLLNGEQAAAHKEFFGSERLNELVDAGQKNGLKKSLETTAIEYVRAWKKKAEYTREILALFDDFDALVSPSLVIEAVTLDTNLQTAFRRRGGVSVLGALCGVPNLTMPMGFGKNKMPVGLSITGDLFDENTILQIGMLYQRETDWHLQRPPTG